MLGSLGQNLIYLVDTSFIGRVSEYDLGGSAIGGIFYFLILAVHRLACRYGHSRIQ